MNNRSRREQPLLQRSNHFTAIAATEDSAYFSRYFRKQTGVTPTEFQAAAHRDLSLN
jgi:AraC-like DNA-binding protein